MASRDWGKAIGHIGRPLYILWSGSADDGVPCDNPACRADARVLSLLCIGGIAVFQLCACCHDQLMYSVGGWSARGAGENYSSLDRKRMALQVDRDGRFHKTDVDESIQ